MSKEEKQKVNQPKGIKKLKKSADDWYGFIEIFWRKFDGMSLGTLAHKTYKTEGSKGHLLECEDAVVLRIAEQAGLTITEIPERVEKLKASIADNRAFIEKAYEDSMKDGWAYGRYGAARRSIIYLRSRTYY